MNPPPILLVMELMNTKIDLILDILNKTMRPKTIVTADERLALANAIRTQIEEIKKPRSRGRPKGSKDKQPRKKPYYRHQI